MFAGRIVISAALAVAAMASGPWPATAGGQIEIYKPKVISVRTGSNAGASVGVIEDGGQRKFEAIKRDCLWYLDKVEESIERRYSAAAEALIRPTACW